MIRKNKVIVRNIPYFTEEQTVIDFFQDRGFEKVKMAIMARGEEAKRVPIEAVIDVGSEEEVERALDELNGGEEIEGVVIGVRRFMV